MDVIIALGLIVVLFAVLGSGLWIGLSLLAVALVGMELFTNRPVGDSMMLTIWGSTSSWTLTALPLLLKGAIDAAIMAATPKYAACGKPAISLDISRVS